MSFSREFSEWLMEQQHLFSRPSIQKDIFSMIKDKEGFNLLSEEQKELVMKLLEVSLSLSFILNQNESQADNFINFLDKLDFKEKDNARL
ncbi:hypothetical protein ACTS93_10780 [Empedobacter falsenii]